MMTISIQTEYSFTRCGVDVLLTINNKLICLGIFNSEELSILAEEFRSIANELEWRKEGIVDTTN